MVIEGHEPRKSQSLPAVHSLGLPEHLKLNLPSATDRLAAVVLDWLVILVPLLVFVVAPFRRQMTESLLFDSQVQFFMALFSGLLLVLLVIFLYQTFFTYKFGGTLGKMAFGLRVVNVWHQSRPDLEASAWRALFWILAVLLGGLPWLSIFSNPLRRTLHDKLSDTVVVTLRPPLTSGAPGYFQMAFVRGVYAALISLGLTVLAVSVMGVLQHLNDEEKLKAWLDPEASVTMDCEAVSDATENKEMTADERLQAAMELFAGGLISQSCLAQEAESTLNQDGVNSELAYLAMAFATSEDAPRSNEYLEETCKLAPKSEACHMTSIVQHWSNEDWGKVAELFQQLPVGASSHVLVWKIRYLMRQGQYAQALEVITQLNGHRLLADYLIPERVKALWRVQQINEAKMVAITAFETLHQPERTHLSGWLCYEELVRECSATATPSCQTLVSDFENDTSELQPSGWLAMVLINEQCASAGKEKDYIALKNRLGPGAGQKLISSLEHWAKGNVEQAKMQMTTLVQDEQLPELIRGEALRRLIGWSQSGAELKALVKTWSELKIGPRLTIGPSLFQALKNKGELRAALDVGQKLVEGQRPEPQLFRDMVVTAFQLGRRQEALALLKTYERQNDRSPAAADPFTHVRQQLMKSLGGP